ncbi:uncharacterized protein V1516DRAFT_646355 [Lipomyces oligophaga]|uniref:uncharacterized protein n=1 Tax=Lipomyces oligophaga TaxID=45792 RepID=UPI0034CD573D
MGICLWFQHTFFHRLLFLVLYTTVYFICHLPLIIVSPINIPPLRLSHSLLAFDFISMIMVQKSPLYSSFPR